MEPAITTIFVNDFVICELDLSVPVLKHRWLRPPESQEFRDTLVTLQKEYIKFKDKHPNLKWLVDTELLGERTPEDEKWLEEVWEQLLFVEAGVKIHAVILSDDIYADYSMEKFKSLADSKFRETGVKLGIFMNEKDANQWLEEQD
ncbi:MAG: hypothetical protein O2887_14910 [Bacteroidetes bacterium]|nr:hypothetical protein [Bacteroidota bacterium]MDA1121756.1 hypothetical protein [Bacteroidota bacterium]